MTRGRLGAPIGRRPVGQGWRIFLGLAAVFNFIVGLLGMLSPEASVDARLVGLFLFAFGVVYLQVARDPEGLGRILWAGAIAKIGTVALFAPSAFGAGSSLPVTIAVGMDALFAVGFLALLLSRGEDV